MKKTDMPTLSVNSSQKPGSDQPLRKSLGEADELFEEAPEGFDEVAYCLAFPDVSRSIKTGEFQSALHHYRVHGQREDRLADLRYQRASIRGNTAFFPRSNIDVLFGSDTGECLIVGWIKDDDKSPIQQITLLNKRGLWGTTQNLPRCRRKDVSDTLGVADDRLLGFWAVIIVEHPETMASELEMVISTLNERKTLECQVRPVSGERLRESVLEHVSKAQYFGNAVIETFLQLDTGVGKSIIGLNIEVSRRIAQGAHILRFGSAPSALEGSIVVCLYDKPEFLLLQAALFSNCRDFDRYEIIYVSNSPAIAERLVKDATIASRIYGTAITLVILPGNAGFGMANNVAVNAARCSRVLIVNPDVFPLEPSWPRQHSEFVKSLPPDQVAVFSVPLFYDDGSLMHGGMYFEMDTALSVRDKQIIQREMIRVEHYGKGAPPATRSHLSSRPVPAVTGAFISLDRYWFESLGGFSPEYIFGHYEDADLCLKSLTAGKPAWMHNVPFLHLEGKGSTTRPAHSGGSLVNRWHFSNRWGQFVKNNLYGKTPELLKMRG